MSRQQTAVAVSAGIPTSQGSQYLDMRPPIWRVWMSVSQSTYLHVPRMDKQHGTELLTGPASHHCLRSSSSPHL